MDLRTFQGVLPPLLTPFEDDGSVDAEGVKNIVNHVIERGADGLFPAGSTGEGPCLTLCQWEALIAATARAARGRVPVFAGCIDTSLPRVMEKVKRAGKLGADAVVITPPFYFTFFNTDDIVAHYASILKESPVPVVAYNIPQCTHNALSVDGFERIAASRKLVGLKDSSGDWATFQLLLDVCKTHGIALLQGSESQSASAVLLGASGIVPGFGNYHPRLAKELYLAAASGNIAASMELQRKARKVSQIWRVTRFPYVAGKVALNIMGLCGTKTTVPERATAEQRKRIRQILLDTGAI